MAWRIFEETAQGHVRPKHRQRWLHGQWNGTKSENLNQSEKKKRWRDTELRREVNFSSLSSREHALVQKVTERPLRCGRMSFCDRRWAEERGKSHGWKGVWNAGMERNGGRGEKIEKPNLSVGDWATVRLDRRWSRDAIFSRIELLIAKVQNIRTSTT